MLHPQHARGPWLLAGAREYVSKSQTEEGVGMRMLVYFPELIIQEVAVISRGGSGRDRETMKLMMMIGL